MSQYVLLLSQLSLRGAMTFPDCLNSCLGAIPHLISPPRVQRFSKHASKVLDGLEEEEIEEEEEEDGDDDHRLLFFTLLLIGSVFVQCIQNPFCKSTWRARSDPFLPNKRYFWQRCVIWQI